MVVQVCSIVVNGRKDSRTDKYAADVLSASNNERTSSSTSASPIASVEQLIAEEKITILTAALKDEKQWHEWLCV
jgi:hypothetical protein